MGYVQKGEKLEYQDQRFLDRVVRDFKRNGLHLPEEERNKIKDLKKKISVYSERENWEGDER
jgi:Zn-dependent oligopeptidase